MTKTPQTTAQWIATARRRIAENGGPFEARASQRPLPRLMIAADSIPGVEIALVATANGQDGKPLFHWVDFGSGAPQTLDFEDLIDFDPQPAIMNAPKGMPAVGASAVIKGAAPGPFATNAYAPKRSVTILAYSLDRRFAWVREGQNRPFAVLADKDAFH